MEKVKLELVKNSYDIVIGDKIFNHLPALLKKIIKTEQVIIITDKNLAELYLNKAENLLSQEFTQVNSITLNEGEELKSYQSFASLCEKILSFTPDRNCCLIALGGGVIGDLVGFAASVILRGINFIQIPTSLLACVDSSVGGKTGINSDYGKNLIGSFKQPKLVFIDVDTLTSLPYREYLAGYVEACKYSLINNREYFLYLVANEDKIKARDKDFLVELIKYSCQSKADIVAQDETEKTGVRALLNLGHTFAHSLEKAFSYSADLKHGEAVAIGMVLAFKFSAKLDLCASSETKLLEQHFNNLEINYELKNLPKKLQASELVSYMYQDKKVENGKLNFILNRKIGESFMQKDVASDLLTDFLENELA